MHGNILTSFLKLLNVKYTRLYSSQIFNEHPYKYNLYGISQMLQLYGIETIGIKIEDKKDFLKLKVPFIAKYENDFVLIEQKTSNNIKFILKNKEKQSKAEQFIKGWSGIVLLAITNNKSIELNYKEHLKKMTVRKIEKFVFLCFGVGFIIYMYIMNILYLNVGSTISLILNMGGIYICSLLAQKQLHMKNTYADKICTAFKKWNCNNILESPAATLLGIIKWSEIGLAYFISDVIVILFASNLFSYSAFINIFTLPYTFWSVWYQKTKIHKWCPLCLIVLVLLWLIFISNTMFGNISMPTFKFNEIFIITYIYIIPFIALTLSIPFIDKSNKIIEIKQKMNSLKMNEDVFITLLRKQPYHKVDLSTSQIIFGNPNANILITIFSNPHCNPCALMHTRVYNILKKFGDKIAVQYIFTSFNKDLDISNKFLISTYFNNTKDSALKIYNKWFMNGKFNKESFFKKYCSNNNNEKVESEFEEHQKFAKHETFSGTPTVMINGYNLPEEYKVEDLEYFTNLVVNTR